MIFQILIVKNEPNVENWMNDHDPYYHSSNLRDKIKADYVKLN